MRSVAMANLAPLVALAGVILAPSFSMATCPSHAMGLTNEAGSSGRIFYATEMAEALSDNNDSRELAAAQARIAARVLLKNSNDVPKSGSGILRGVVDLGSCSAGLFVYATVSLDEANARRAASLEALMATTPPAGSSADGPPPSPEDLRSTFDRLMAPKETKQ